MKPSARWISVASLVALAALTTGCAHEHGHGRFAETQVSSARCDGGAAHAGMMHGGMMHGGMMQGGMMQGGMMHGGMAGAGPMMGPPMAAGGPVVPPGDARPLGDEAKTALVRALQAEYDAEALYDGIVASVGRETPATPLARSERRHAWVLESLLVAHGADVPASAATKPAPFASKGAACTAGVQSEKKTIALYDELLGRSTPPDVKRAFEHLRTQSTHHLAAFERCATGK